MTERFIPGKRVRLTTAGRQYEEDTGWYGSLVVATTDETGVLVRNEKDEARWMNRKGLETLPPPMVDSMEVPELEVASVAAPAKFWDLDHTLSSEEMDACMKGAREMALRYNQGKPPLSYILAFPDALRAFARVCAYGARKYNAFNFVKGAPTSQSVDSLLRHLSDWQNGQDIDPESGEHHLAHVLWNALRLCQEALCRPDLDDRNGYPQEARRRG